MAAPTRRAFLRSAGGVLAGAVLGACGRAGPTQPPAHGAMLTLVTQSADPLVSAELDLVSVAAALAESYGAAGGTARIVPREPAGGLASYAQGLLVGAPPFSADLLCTTSAVRDLPGAGGVMLGLGPALRESGLAPGLYPQALAYCAPAGQQRMIPLFRDPLVVYYNADAFSRAGIDPPAPDWTSADLLQVCTALLTHFRGTVAPLANAVNVFDLELLDAFVLGYGGEMLTSVGGGPGYRPTFTGAQAITGIQALLSLHAFEPAPGGAAPLATFCSGSAAIYFGHRRELAALQARIGGLFAWNAASLPAFPHRTVQPLRAQGVAAITRAPAQREAAVAFALFVATPTGQEAVARTGVGVPALRALAQSSLWRQSTPQLDNDVFVARPESDVIVDAALWYVAPQLEAAMRAVLGGAAVAATFKETATAVSVKLGNWPNV